MKVDKGQITVILDKSTYVEQMTKTLDDNSTYKQIKKDRHFDPYFWVILSTIFKLMMYIF